MDDNSRESAPAPDPVQPSHAANELLLDGRKFRFVSQALTAAQDDWIIGHLRRCGAVEALADDHTPDYRRAEEMLTRVLLAGETSAVLAGVLIEVGANGEGKRWTRAEAERNTLRFAAITDAGEKLLMRDALVGFVLAFFDSARRSAATSRKSSSPAAEGPSTKNAEAATSETLLPSSEPSPAAIPAASSGC